MITTLCIVYTALVVLLFKFKFLKPRPYPIAWVAVAGVLLIGAIVVAWQQFAPMSSRVVTTQYVVQLVPYVKGQVIKVSAQANQHVKKGDLLLEIDPAPYLYKVNQLQAQLDVAKDTVKQAQAGLEAANANIVKAGAGIKQAQAEVAQSKAALVNAQASLTKAKAALASSQAGVVRSKAADELAKTEEQIALNVQKQDVDAISKLQVAKAVQNRQEADAAYKQAQTGADEAQAAVNQADAGVSHAQATVLKSEAGVAEAQSEHLQSEAAARQAQFALKVAQGNVPVVQAQLDDARFNLNQCRMLAPDDGYIVNWQVQEGTMIVSAPVAPAGVFICTSHTYIAASFPQNYLGHVQAGDEVEVILDPYPGQLFKAKVDTVITATGEGQFAPSGTIPDASRVGSQGLLAVKISLVDQVPPASLPLGAGGVVAIYTDYGQPVHIISKVTIRMKKWLMYVMPS